MKIFFLEFLEIYHQNSTKYKQYIKLVSSIKNLTKNSIQQQTE